MKKIKDVLNKISATARSSFKSEFLLKASPKPVICMQLHGQLLFERFLLKEKENPLPQYLKLV